MRVFGVFILLLALVACSSTTNNTPVEINSEFTATDPDYGYSADAPILLGGFLRGTEYQGAHIEFFDNLRGPNGEKVDVRRLGSCCAFEDPSVPFGGGLLDRYELTYRGQKEPKVIFVNLYKFERPMAPVGFTLL